MNKIYLKGKLKSIEPSHVTNGIQYDQANLLITNKVNKESLITVKFRHADNKVFREEDIIEIIGNVRSHSEKITDKFGNERNKVDIYVFSHLDDVTESDKEFVEEGNTDYFEITGRICKMDGLREFGNGKHNTHFVLVNNIVSEYSRLNSYLPCVCWGNLAKFATGLNVNDQILVKGELHSREYVKKFSDGTEEIRVAHELLVSNIEVLPDDYKEE